MTKHCPQIDSSTQVPDLSCRPCGKEGHANPTCTYQYYVPKGEQVGRGATLICTCCKKEGCHPGTNDWVGIAVPNYCKICGKRYEHRTEDCPRKQGMEMVGDQAAFVGSASAKCNVCWPLTHGLVSFGAFKASIFASLSVGPRAVLAHCELLLSPLALANFGSRRCTLCGRRSSISSLRGIHAS
ncbi:hypothetical protein ACFX15_044882 [Malus domestica]